MEISPSISFSVISAIWFGYPIKPKVLNFLRNVTSNLLDQLDAKADSSNYRGALVYHAAPQVLVDNVTSTLIWDNTTYDTDDIHDEPGLNSRLVVPAGTTKVRVASNIVIGAGTTGYAKSSIIHSAGNKGVAQDLKLSDSAISLFNHFNITTAVMNVVAGEYFYVNAIQNSGTSQSTVPTDCWFAMELLG